MADDPLAPIQPGDDLRKLFSASRQNALAAAARVVQGHLPVRWARKRKAKGGSHLWGFAKLAEELLPGASAEAKLQTGDPPTDSDETITVWDHALHNNLFMPEGTLIQYAKSSEYERYYVVNAYTT